LVEKSHKVKQGVARTCSWFGIFPPLKGLNLVILTCADLILFIDSKCFMQIKKTIPDGMVSFNTKKVISYMTSTTTPIKP
jgi:hypothetical protein